MKPNLDACIDWRKEEHVAEFLQLVDDISNAKSNEFLIQATIRILEAAGDAPDKYRERVQFAARRLSATWLDIERRWEDGEIRDIGPELSRVRPNNWRQGAVKKRLSKGPLIFAEMSFLISEGKTRDQAKDQMLTKHGGSKTEIDNLYDEHKKDLRLASERKRPILPSRMGDAFLQVAKEHQGGIRRGITELGKAIDRACNSTQKTPKTSGKKQNK